MHIRELSIEVASDLKDYGRTEDGTPYIGEMYYVQITNARGDRWRHIWSFDGVLPGYDPESGYTYFEDTRKWAKAQAEHVVVCIRRRGYIDFRYWNPTRPEYGSMAYQEYGQDDDLAWERACG